MRTHAELDSPIKAVPNTSSGCRWRLTSSGAASPSSTAHHVSQNGFPLTLHRMIAQGGFWVAVSVGDDDGDGDGDDDNADDDVDKIGRVRWPSTAQEVQGPNELFSPMATAIKLDFVVVVGSEALIFERSQSSTWKIGETRKAAWNSANETPPAYSS